MKTTAFILAFCASTFPLAAKLQAQTADTSDIVGLWKAKKSFGPFARGPLLITRAASGYVADMAGFTMPVTPRDGELWFDLPNRAGSFRGKVQANGSMRGIWFVAPIGDLGPAVPVTLLPDGTNRWQGEVVPQEDTQTFYLLITRQPDGSLGAVLRNIERDYGGLLGVRGVVRTGNRIELTGRRGAMTRDTVLITGSYDSARNVITVNFPNRGGHYDFRRDDDAFSDFYPRGKRSERYSYRAPPVLNDGWPVTNAYDVGIDRAAIERAVQAVIDMSMDSINAPQVHAVLVARKGRLILEEYFHGEHRTKPHNLRSASKSITAVIAGAAMLQGTPLKLSSPVYEVMNGGRFPSDLEPRKRAMTLEHLLTMSSGWFCDDNNENAPGREDTLWDNRDAPDFAKYALTLPMATSPGEQPAIYCSIQPHVALQMVGRAAGESPFWLFDRLVAQPLGITNYVWAIDRNRNPYGGGGMGLTARDFLKLGQLMLDSGVWQGKRIVSKEFVARAGSTLAKINNTRPYGLLWWPDEKPYGNGVAKFYAALGAGGQLLWVFPELDLVVVTNGGSYASRGWRYVGAELIPNLILPAVRSTR
jgi:CubicO group peptidase (beta-lactamase class C family)